MTPIVAKRPMLENGACSSDTERQKYKRRGISVVRDFPPGCGPNAPKADLSGNETKNTEYVAGDCPEVESKGTLFAPESHASTNSLDKSVDMVLEEGELEVVTDEHSFDGLVNLSKSLPSTDIAEELLTGSCDCPEVENKGTPFAPESHASTNSLDKSVDVVLEEGELELITDEHSFDGLVNLSKSLASTDIAEELLTGSCDCPEVKNKGTLFAPESHASMNGLDKSVEVALEEGELVELMDEHSFEGLVNLPTSLASTDIAEELLTGSCDCPKVKNKGTLFAPESHASVNSLDKSVEVVLEEGELVEFMMDEHSFEGLVNLPKSLASTDIAEELLTGSCDCPEVKSVEVALEEGELVELMMDEHSFDGLGDLPKSLESADIPVELLTRSWEGPASMKSLDKLVDVVLDDGELVELTMDEHSFDGFVEFPNSLESADILGELLPRSCDSSETLQVNAESVTQNLLHGTQEPSKGLTEEKLELPGVLNTIQSLEIKDGNKISVSEERKVVEGYLPHHAIPSVVFKERKYPPRRSVSAIRNFPPGCGTNMLSSKSCLQVDAPLECKVESGTNKAGMRTNEQEITSCIHDDVVFGSKMADDAPCGRIMQRMKGQHESDRETAMHLVQPSKSSDVQCRMTEQQRSKCVQSEKLKLARDRNIEKGASECRDSKVAIAYRKDKGDERRKTVYPDLSAKNMAFSHHEEGRVSVRGPTTAVNCPRQEKRTAAVKFRFKSRPHGEMKDTEKWKEESKKKARPSMHDPGVVPGEKLGRAEKTPTENDRRHKHLSLVAQSCKVDVSLRPFGASRMVDGSARNKVRETLRLFHALTRKLLQEKERNPPQKRLVRVDLQALSIFTAKGKYCKSQKPIVGRVAGVEVGDEFHYRVELMLVGLHRPPQAGIDSVKEGERVIATSIVESGGYDNNVDNSDVWIYTGEGGNVTGKNKVPEDQKLERGNLALKNSIHRKNFIRVIRGVKDTNPSTTAGGAPKSSNTYTYYGLYTVERYWIEIGKRGKKEFKFELKRVPGQPVLTWKEVKKSKKLKIREDRCVADISGGKEQFPICAVNAIDCEKPPPFTYIMRMMYPDRCKPLPSRGCNCKNGCLNSDECSCVVKNGGEIPYNFDGAIVRSKPLVYECGPSCKCPPSCYNRVSQHGIRFELEIFKTESRGWGVRSLYSIPSGSFICEYTGKLLEDKEAEQRTGDDEYLFDIGRNYSDHSLWEGLRSLIPDAESSCNEVVADAGFTIDAARYGNVGRFINHSCSPNLYAQDVLYDHGDTRMPHVMFFAAENIPPLQELTYHYNYAIGQVYDEDGNEKVKHCYCGSSDCTGRMY